METLGSKFRSLYRRIHPVKNRQLEFASTERVNAHQILRDEFVQRVLQMEWAFISNESSLWDFHEELTSAILQARIKDIYGVGVSDIVSGSIADILDRIAASRIHST